MSCIDESFLLSSAALSVIVFTKYSNKTIDVFVSKLNEVRRLGFNPTT